tara:strand:+ start:9647 stop:11002 length:1356 start_codon:yes stop_codon:yes gene_type:complete
MSYINTIADLEAQTYGMTGHTGINNQLLKQAGSIAGLHTGHDAALTVSSANSAGAATSLGTLYNKVYGQKVWSMLNRECNALSVISKRPYTSSGWRVLSERPAGGSGNFLDLTGVNEGTTDATIGNATMRPDLLGGVPENAGLSTAADGLASIAPKYEQLFTSPKIIAHQFEFSELAMEMAAIDDGIGDIRAQMREDMGKHHAETQNAMLVMPLENYNLSATNQISRIEQNYTSLMKVVSSKAELDAMAAGTVLTANATAAEIKTLYGKDRAGASFLDAQVDFGGVGYATGNARSLTLTVLNKTLRDLRVAGGSPKVILTGYDTLQTISDLLQAQERFMDRKEIVPTVNGVRGVKGQEVGFRVSTYYDIPMIPVAAMPTTGANTSTISDMLFLDTDHLWLSVMKPTQYFEDGISNGNPFGVGHLGNKALYRTIGEVGCSYFRGQGKITNLL